MEDLFRERLDRKRLHLFGVELTAEPVIRPANQAVPVSGSGGCSLEPHQADDDGEAGILLVVPLTQLLHDERNRFFRLFVDVERRRGNREAELMVQPARQLVAAKVFVQEMIQRLEVGFVDELDSPFQDRVVQIVHVELIRTLNLGDISQFTRGRVLAIQPVDPAGERLPVPVRFREFLRQVFHDLFMDERVGLPFGLAGQVNDRLVLIHSTNVILRDIVDRHCLHGPGGECLEGILRRQERLDRFFHLTLHHLEHDLATAGPIEDPLPVRVD